MKKHIYMTILFVLVTGLVSACGTKHRENVSEEMSSIEKGQTEEGGSLASLLGVTSDTISYETESCSVNAAVDIPDVPKAAIYCQERQEMSAEGIKKIATGLFDAGTLESVRPFAAYSQDELMEAKQNFETQALEARKQARDEGKADWKAWSQSFDYQYHDVRQLLEDYNGEPDVWQENTFYKQKNGLNILIYQGSISGEGYFLIALGREEGIKLYLYKQGEPWAQTIDLFEQSWQERAMDELNDIVSGKNQCVMSLEDAKNAAEAFLEKYGFTDMVMTEVKDAIPQCDVYVNYDGEAEISDTEDEGNDIPTGYSFYFVRSYGGIPVEYRDNVVVTGGNSFNTFETQGESYHVVVNDAGVVYMAIGEMYYVTEALTDQSTLMSFEQINRIAKEQLSLTSYGGEINHIDFRYKNMEYDGQIVLMPVWIYSASMNGDIWMGERRNNILVLNAVDGSVAAMDSIQQVSDISE